MDALEWERAVVVGHSWGGNVALQFGADHPDRTAGVVLVDGDAAAVARAIARDYPSTETLTRSAWIDDQVGQVNGAAPVGVREVPRRCRVERHVVDQQHPQDCQPAERVQRGEARSWGRATGRWRGRPAPNRWRFSHTSTRTMAGRASSTARPA